MAIDLPRLLPRAIAWAEAQSAYALQFGTALGEPLLTVARRVGVGAPECIRVLTVDGLPLPPDAELAAAAADTGMLTPSMVGLTLGHAIVVCRGHDSLRLMSHEFRHVHQYEQFGSIAAFLSTYLQQILEFGYVNAPLERDARAHEIHGI